MSAPASVLETIRDAIVKALQNVAEFSPLSTFDGGGAVTASAISAWKKGDPASVSAAQIAATGVAIVVMVTSARESGDQSIQAFFDRVPILICITENTRQNRHSSGSQLGALWLAERCVANLKDAQLTGTDFLISTDPSVETIRDGNPFRSLFTEDADSEYNTQFVSLTTKAAATIRTTP